VTAEKLKAWNVEALLLGGCATTWDKYDFDRCQELFDVIREGDLPVIGFCGGHQFIGYAYGTPSAPVGPLPEGMEPPRPGDTSGMLWEYGYSEVQILQPDPLFEGLGDPPVFWESHWWEVQAVPQGFSLLASTEPCGVQALKHQDRLVYGTQFHPEAYNDDNPDGKRLLVNFFRMAGLI
jgi:GMP synthase (glutamine-hydrolysing)